ncbi:aspartate/glutamate racemase family protein [Spongiimicrobium sp. 3-5]|uniref:aspartate/glutamate racemase family protein n=1 Tax=Spongiimicrobium sp. 3-5 TaxID=3332596 RepID=UPI00397EB9E1
MKTIGLIGGMGWQSSKLYYEYINQQTNALLGRSHIAKSIMVTVDFDEIEQLTVKGDWEAIGAIMKKSAQQLERAGADIVVLCTNLIHLVSDYIKENVNIPFLHIAEATGEKIQAQGLKKVALLGTKFTMEMDFYTKILKEVYGVEVVIPEEADRQIIHTMIYTELLKGQFSESSKQTIKDIIIKLQKQGAQGVVMACTELSILVPDGEVTLPTFDTGKIHAHKAVAWANER